MLSTLEIESQQTGMVSRANRTASSGADAYVLALFRIVLSLVGIAYLVAYFLNCDLLWMCYDEPTQLCGKALCLLGILSSAIRLVGAGGQKISLLHFLAVTFLLPFSCPLRTVDMDMYLMMSFWACFMPLDRQLSMRQNKSDLVAGWPVLLLGINLAMFLLSAGLFKLFDPLWSKGLGLYMVLSLPFTRPEIFAGLANFRLPVAVANFAAIGMELVLLPCILISPLRIVAAILLFLFALGVMAPIHVPWIGFICLAGVLAICSMSPQASRLIRTIARQPLFEFSRSPKNGRTDSSKVLLTALVSLLVLMSFYCLLKSPWGWSERGKQACIMERARNRIAKCLHPVYSPALLCLNRHTLCLGPKAMFISGGAATQFAYRVEVTAEDGSRLNCLDVFRVDGTAGADLLGMRGIPVLDCMMAPVAVVARQVLANKACEGGCAGIIDSLLSLCAKRTHRAVKCVDLLVAPIPISDNFIGAAELWRNPHWIPIRRWFPSQGVHTIPAFSHLGSGQGIATTGPLDSVK
jgi:hypothetical protein